MPKLNKMFLENLICSNLYDNGVAVPCGSQYGEVSENLWASWFPLVEQVRDGQSNKKNTENLSLWRDGRGSFVDCYSTQDNAFFDVKCLMSFKGLLNQKIEVWAGSPVAGEKRSDAMAQSASEVVQAFIKDSHNHQIIQSLFNTDKPYILMVAFPKYNVDGTWETKCVCVNVSKYIAHRKDTVYGGKSKSGVSGLIYRTKKQTSVDYNESICARVEVKFWESVDTLEKMGIATKEQNIDDSFAHIL